MADASTTTEAAASCRRDEQGAAVEGGVAPRAAPSLLPSPAQAPPIAAATATASYVGHPTQAAPALNQASIHPATAASTPTTGLAPAGGPGAVSVAGGLPVSCHRPPPEIELEPLPAAEAAAESSSSPGTPSGAAAQEALQTSGGGDGGGYGGIGGGNGGGSPEGRATGRGRREREETRGLLDGQRGGEAAEASYEHLLVRSTALS